MPEEEMPLLVQEALRTPGEQVCSVCIALTPFPGCLRQAAVGDKMLTCTFGLISHPSPGEQTLNYSIRICKL